jgi:4-hydroxybenzoate polyprenyltransferase
VRGYLELVRPANVATALADVLAGFAIAGLYDWPALPWLLVATACLYAGGIVFNDTFDRHLDAVERPERPIPSGRVPVAHAVALGAGLLGAGILAASLVTPEAAIVAGLIAAAVLLYDAWGKHVMFIGPVTMGLCRGLNLVLGMTARPEVIASSWPLALLTVTYIAAVTTLSRGEVAGGKRPVAILALALLGAVLFGLLFVALGGLLPSGPGDLAPVALAERSIPALLLALVLAWRVLPPFWRAVGDPRPQTIRVAIRTGVLSLVLLDAVFAAAYAGMIYSLAVLATALLAGWLARRFSVT